MHIDSETQKPPLPSTKLSRMVRILLMKETKHTQISQFPQVSSYIFMLKSHLFHCAFPDGTSDLSTSGGFPKWGYPQFSSILFSDFPLIMVAFQIGRCPVRIDSHFHTYVLFWPVFSHIHCPQRPVSLWPRGHEPCFP